MAAPVAYQAAYLLHTQTNSGEKIYMVNKQNEECYINMRRASMRASGEGKLYYVLRREIRLEWLTMSYEQKTQWLTSMSRTKQFDFVTDD